MTKVVSLFSGGLDSILIVYLLEDLGFKVIPICFETPFFPSDKAQKIAKENKFNLEVINITSEYLKMFKTPRYGYGKNLNPCIDCHGMMIRIAYAKMTEYGAKFIATGEVLAQRSMSQTKNSLLAVSKISTAKQYIIRPLCQKLLADTIVIKEGIIDKKKLLDISGKSRTRQIALAQKYGIKNIPNSGGGCLLTDKGYSMRLKDLIENSMLKEEFLNFLVYGRHFRIDKDTKLILGRNERENEILAKIANNNIAIKALEVASPLGIIQSKREVDEVSIATSASILLGYCNKIKSNTGKIIFGKIEFLENVLTAKKFSHKEMDNFRINPNQNCKI